MLMSSKGLPIAPGPLNARIRIESEQPPVDGFVYLSCAFRLAGISSRGFSLLLSNKVLPGPAPYEGRKVFLLTSVFL